jgi:hypothetical protein
VGALLFVYNVDSGPIAGLLDLIHKIVSPKTYVCNLCAVTYSFTGMRAEWKRFIQGLPMAVEFLHRDELVSRSGELKERLPAVYQQVDGSLRPLIDASSINACRTLDDLENLVRQTVKGMRAERGGS